MSSSAEDRDIIQLLESDTRKAIELVKGKEDYQSKFILGCCYLKLAMTSDAIKVFEELVLENRNDIDAINNIGSCYFQKGEFISAKKYYLQALDVKKNATSLNGLGNVYQKIGEYSNAVKSYKESLKINPNDGTITNLSNVYIDSRNYKKAIKLLEGVVEKTPGQKLGLAISNLMIGNMKEGSEYFRSRFEYFPVGMVSKKYYPKETEWWGENFEGTVAIYCEQGIGDTLHMCRYYEDLKNKYPKINFVWHVDDSLKSLFDKQGWNTGSLHSPKDKHCSAFEIPYILDDWVGNTGKYIEAPKAEFDGYDDKLKVGVVWAGNAIHPRDCYRSAPLSLLKEIGEIKNVAFFSLQKEINKRYWPGVGVVDLTEDCEDIKLIGLGEHMTDWYKTAQLVNAMDVIVTVDTSMLHIAGALGKETLAMIPWSPDWRWGPRGVKCPIYRSVKMIRQKKFNDWSDVAENIIGRIRKMSLSNGRRMYHII